MITIFKRGTENAAFSMVNSTRICAEALRLLLELREAGLSDVVEFEVPLIRIPLGCPRSEQRAVAFAVSVADGSLSLPEFSNKYLRPAMQFLAGIIGPGHFSADALALPCGLAMCDRTKQDGYSMRLTADTIPTRSGQSNPYAIIDKYYDLPIDEFRRDWVNLVLRFDVLLTEPLDA